jgi:hypothetical protein
LAFGQLQFSILIFENGLTKCRSSSIKTQRFTFENFDKNKASWDDYIFAFEQMCRARGLYHGDHADYATARRQVLLAHVGLEALKIVRNHFRPADVNDQTYDNVKAALQNFYKPKVTVFSARIDFMKRNRLDNETVGQYANALRELADAAEYGAAVIDFMLRDRFAAGIRHEKTEIEFRQKWPNGKDGNNDVTFEQVLRLAETIERAELECNKERLMERMAIAKRPVNAMMTHQSSGYDPDATKRMKAMPKKTNIDVNRVVGASIISKTSAQQKAKNVTYVVKSDILRGCALKDWINVATAPKIGAN